MGGPHGRSSSTTKRPSSAASPTRRASRRSSTVDKGVSKKDASRLLKATLAEEEKKQLAAWLDKKHKEVDAKLKKLGVPSPMKLDARNKGPEKGEQGPSADDDIMMILGKRLGKGARPVHTHRTEFLLDEEGGGGGGLDDESEACTSPSRPPSYVGRGASEDREVEADGVPLAARLAAAAKRHQYNARQVLELFFPLWDDHKMQHDTKALLPLEQVLDVLAVDLGLKLSRSEQRVLAREADKDKGARVDVGRLLEEAGLWPQGTHDEGTQDEWAKSAERGRTHWAAAARREAGPRPDSDRARARLQQRRHDAAVHIQRMVRGRLARNHTSTIRFNKMTSRHQAVRDGKSRPTSSTATRRRSSEKAADLEKAAHGEKGSGAGKGAEREGTAAHRVVSAWGETRGHEKSKGLEKGKEAKSKGPGKGAVLDEDLDILFEEAFGGAFEAFSRREGGKVEGGRGGTVVELMKEPVSPPKRREEPEKKEKGDKGKKGKGKEEAPVKEVKEDRLRDLFEREDWSGVTAPYGEGLMAAVAKGGDGGFYQLAALLRGMQMGHGEGMVAFLPYNRIRAALKEAGYSLGESEASAFLLGVGCDKHGSLDVAEVLQALADLRHEIALTSAPSPPLRPAGTQNTRQAGYLRASEMVYPDGSSASPGRRSQGPRRPILGPAEREVLAQLRKGRKEGRRLGGAQLLAPFLEFDPFQDGFVGLMEFAGCLDGLGLTLGNDDIAELAFKYRCPEGVMEGEGASGMGVDYAPFVRFIVDATGGRRRRRGRAAEEGSGSEGEGEESEGDREEEDDEESEEEEGHGRGKGRRRRSEEEEDFGYGRKASKRSGERVSGEDRGFLTDHDHMSSHAEAIASLQDLFYASGDKRRTLKTLRLCLTKADTSGCGGVDRATLAKALRQANVELGEKDWSDLSAFLGSAGGDGAHLLAYPRLLRVWEGVLDCPKESAHGHMTKLLDGVGRGAGVRLRWVRRLKKLLINADKYRSGVLEAGALVKLMQADAEGHRLPAHLSTNRLTELASAFITEDRDGVAYRPLLRSLAHHAGRWYELDPEMATRLLRPFPRLSPPQRFLCALRRTLRELDHGAEGRIDADDVDFALRNKARLGLNDKEASSVLDALAVDGSGKVDYEELLAFFQLYTLPWHELVDDVAHALASQLFPSDAHGAATGWRRFSALRAFLHDRDRAKTGTVSSKVLKEGMAAAQLTLRGEDFLRLIEALEVVGTSAQEGPTAGSPTSAVRYRALLRHLLEYHGEAREEVVEGLIAVVRRHLAEHQGGVRQGMAAILQGCVHDDDDKSGRVSIESFRRALQRCGVRVELEDVGRLADVCDAHGDGKIDYRSILDQVSAGQASASSASTRRSRTTGGGIGRKRPRDWTWARNPTFLCLRSELSHLPAATREKAVKKAFAEFDRQEEGSVAVEEMEEIFSTLASLPGSGNGGAVVVSQAELRDLCASLYGQSMGQSGPSGGRRCIAYDEVVKALILGEKDFDARYPAPLVRRPGAETRLLYERVLQERRNVVVGHKTPQDKGEGKGGAKAEGEEGKFLAACRMIDRKKTGLISAMDVRKVATQLSLKPKPPLTLKALIDNNTVGVGRVKYERFLDDYLGRPSNANRRGSASASGSPSPKITKLLTALTEVKEDAVPHGLLARVLRRAGFEGSTQEVMNLTKGLAGASGRSVKKSLLLTHIREHGAERLLDKKGEKGGGEGEESEEGEEGRTTARGAAGKKAVAFAAKKRVSAF